MFLLRRIIAVLWCGLLFAAALRAEFRIPPVAGELHGKFKTAAIPGAPDIDWKLLVSPLDRQRRHLVAEITANGTRFEAAADLDASTGDGTWEIKDTEIDAGVWFALAQVPLGAGAANIVVGGKMKVGGNGAIRHSEPVGTIRLVWTDGFVRNSVEGWTIEGVNFNGEIAANFSNGSALKQNAPVKLEVRTITTTRFGARNLAVTAQLNNDRTISLLDASVELAGGNVTIDPGTIHLDPLALDLTFRVNRVGLQDLVALVPASLADARGRITGVVRLGWSEAAGIQIGEGGFALLPDEAATLRLAPAPGFFTDKMPKRFTLLPKWTGVIGRRFFSPVNPAYPELRDIELGQAQLQIEAFELRLTPSGDDQQRSASVHVVARPSQANRTIKSVTFDINVTGPLSALLKAGMHQGASFKVH